MNYTEMARHVRHDLIKHLDIPHADENLSRSAAQVLLRRLFDPGTGLCRMAAVWGFKLRHDENWNSALDPALQEVEAAGHDLGTLEPQMRAALKQGGIVDPSALNAIIRAANAVHCFEQTCNDLDNHSFEEDESACLDFFGLGTVPTTAQAAAFPPMHEAADVQNRPENIPANHRANILVVDDHLMSIERMQAHPVFQKKFNWITLCGKSDPCSVCPQNGHCDLKRARSLKDTLHALTKSQNQGTAVDAILMDVRFDALRPDELEWIPELPDLNHENQVKSLQGLIIAQRLHREERFCHIPVVMMTARSRLPNGASKLLQNLEGLQFVDDEDSLEVLAARLESVIRLGKEAPVEQGYFWGKSARMQNVRRQIEIMSIGPRTVFIAGPSGAGKSSLVENIIYPMSGRKNLITLDLSSVPDTLVESELFGHVKGAYSGAAGDRAGLIEEANGGILFLDEIGNLSLENQRKLLLFLQDKMVRRIGAAHETRKHVDVKVVVATHLNLAEEVNAGRFRFDLYMRLGPAMRISLPTLAERSEDLPDFINALVKRICQSDDMAPYVADLRTRTGAHGSQYVDFGENHRIRANEICIRFKPATRDLFLSYQWPGNTRELESVLDTLILKAFFDLQMSASQSRSVEIDHYYALSLLGAIDKNSSSLPPSSQSSQSSSSQSSRPSATSAHTTPLIPAAGPFSHFADLRKWLEKTYLCQLYDACSGNLSTMAERLFGTSDDDTVHKIQIRMNQLGLSLRALKKK